MDPEGRTLLARFYTPEGEVIGPPMSVPAGISVEQLGVLLNDHVLKNVRTNERRKGGKEVSGRD